MADVHGFNRWVFLGILGGIIVCLVTIAFRPMSGTEALLLSLFLTVLSMVGSWLASRHYAEISYSANLRVFALKASEKVDNLSKELDRLSVYLRQAADDNDYASHAEIVLAKSIQIEGAIHIIETLKSVNDRSLSDWRGVIGEELDARREEREERQQELEDLVERVETLYTTQLEAFRSPHGSDPALRSELESIKSQLRRLIAQIGGIPVKHFTIGAPREHIKRPCPVCSSSVAYQQRVKEGSVKTIKCDDCETVLVSRFDPTGFVLSERYASENVSCAGCETAFETDVDAMVGGSTEAICPNCSSRNRFTRQKKRIRAKLVVSGDSSRSSAPGLLISESFLSEVQNAMPAQPWPKGASQLVAQRLGVSNRKIQDAIAELIRRGVFKVQINGTLYEPELRSSAAIPRASIN